ncbi:MAG: membrane integrity-associated transporter subunit PqiC [Burkholderiales bacterium]|nr:membrane integrity-associated transporter subunit PqiC [Burkholderiales bacterium]
MRAAVAATLVALVLGGCNALPDKPVRADLYDFGPPPASAAPGASPTAHALVLPEIEASRAFDGLSILYRLGYADAHQLRQYAMARWTAPPTQLVRQRLRETLARDQLVLDSEESAGLARTGGPRPRVLRIQLEEFTHYFETEKQSRAMVRLRCTLLEPTPAGERAVAQRVFSLQSPAPSADAAGGVRALTAAVDAAALEVARWLQQQR